MSTWLLEIGPRSPLGGGDCLSHICWMDGCPASASGLVLAGPRRQDLALLQRPAWARAQGLTF